MHTPTHDIHIYLEEAKSNVVEALCVAEREIEHPVISEHIDLIKALLAAIQAVMTPEFEAQSQSECEEHQRLDDLNDAMSW